MARRESVSGPGDEDEEAFIRSMKRLREERGWTQADLARKMTDIGWSGMYQTTISRMEKGERPVRIGEARGLARVFEVTVGMMIAQPESSKPVESLKNSVMKLEEVRSRLRSDIEEQFVFSKVLLPSEISDVENCGYEDWADDDMKVTIQRFLERARTLQAETLRDIEDAVMEERNAAYEANETSLTRAMESLASDDGVDN